MKVKSKTTMRNKADDLWRKIVKLKGYCTICGKPASQCQLHAHHVIGRSNYATRFDLRNGICLCAYCHKLSPKSAHEDPQGFMQWYEANYKADYDYLDSAKRKPIVLTAEYYEGIIKGLKETLEYYQSEN